MNPAVAIDRTPPAAGEAPLEWRVEPWREARARALASIAITAALAGIAVRVAPAPLVGWGLTVALLATLGPAFMPVTCRVDPAGVARRVAWGWERRAWDEIRRMRLDSTGLYVSTLAHGGALEPFRGLMLPLPRGASRELVAALQREVAAHGG
jgi:hypothetical protein